MEVTSVHIRNSNLRRNTEIRVRWKGLGTVSTESGGFVLVRALIIILIFLFIFSSFFVCFLFCFILLGMRPQGEVSFLHIVSTFWTI